MTKAKFFWTSVAALASLISIGPCEAAAQGSGAQTAKSAAPSKAQRATTAKPKPAYSARRAASRRAALARARAAAYAREIAESLPRLKPDETGLMVPDLRAAAAIVYDPETNEILWEQNSQTTRSIASITKVMTAMVFLENGPDFTQPAIIVGSDVSRASTTFLRAGDKVTTGDLFHLLLIASDNAAARAIARVSPLGPAGFVARMNAKAAEFGLTSTRYADTSGLLADNVSSAFDMARLISLASNDERISSIMRKSEHTIRTANTRPRSITFRSTNHLLGREDLEVRAGKTGFISKAGYCLATLLRLPQGGPEVAVVVLGARSNAGRFVETRNLFDWLALKTSALFGVGLVPASQLAAAPPAPAQ